ncbi:MAG: tail fiber protein [Pseudomonadota bacterium]
MSSVFKKTLPHMAAAAAVATAWFCLDTGEAQACPSDPYIGTMCFVPYSFCPVNWSTANGQVLKVSDNPTLFSVIGATYGGDGQTTFALPDMRGRTWVGAGTGPGLTPAVLGQARGTDTQSVPLPAHTHLATFSPTGTPVPNTLSASIAMTASNANPPSGNTNGPTANAYLSSTPSVGLPAGKIWNTASTNPVPVGGITATATGGAGGGAMTGGTVTIGAYGNTSGDGSLQTIPPQLGLTACIAVNGLYPERP